MKKANKEMSTRREFLARVGGMAVVFSGCQKIVPTGGRVKNGRRPNVILVMTDDQGYGDLACLGNKIIKTPTLDRLYKQSVRLRNFHVGPTCAPTRSSLMTGRYCNRTGVWHTIGGRSLLRKDEVTMAEVFKEGGYRTGIFGKWHLGDNYPFRPADRGFEEVLVHGGGGVGQTPDYWGNHYFDDTYWHNGAATKYEGYCTDVWFDGALKFIEKNKKDPFFCYLATNAAHSPYHVAKKYSQMYSGKDVPNANFYGMITNIDENMDRLLRKLKALDLERETVLIFMTDNGTSGGYRDGKGFNAGMRGVKGSQYEGGHRVPCFIRWPGGELKPATDIDRIAAHVDIMPTLIDICGLKTPTNKLDGVSLLPLLKDTGAQWPDRVLITDSQRIDHPEKWRKCAVMTDRWRLVDGKELYDMKTDPGQKNDVAQKHAKVTASLRNAYEKWWADVSKRFDEYCEIIVGSDKENPSCITCHDRHEEGLVPWNHRRICKGQRGNGFWAIEVERDGKYEISLRRWPEELDKPITAAIPRSVAIEAVKGRLKIGDFDMTKPIEPEAKAVTFNVQLKAGKTRMQTWFIEKNGDSLGAYYVYVKRV